MYHLPTKESLVAMAESERQNRLAVATATIAPLQDAVELGIATEEEKFAMRPGENTGYSFLG